MEAAVKVEQLKQYYHETKAVDDISFEVAKGELFGFLGVNGAGKSTTIKMMSGILTPTSGTCVVNGLEPYKERKKYRLGG